MLLFELLEVIDQCMSNKAYRRKMVIRAIEDAIIIFRLCLYIALLCYGALWFIRVIGLEGFA